MTAKKPGFSFRRLQLILPPFYHCSGRKDISNLIVTGVIVLMMTGFLSLPSYCQTDGFTVSAIPPGTVQQVIDSLVRIHGETHRFRIRKGVSRAASFWRNSDGSEEQFKDFCKDQFIADAGLLAETLKRLEINFEAIQGNFFRISRTFTGPLELPALKKLPMDRLFSEFSPDAHLQEDLFRTKIAFAVILNFPFYNLEEKERLGSGWSRLQWAMANAGDLFTSRVPPQVNQQIARFAAEIDEYVGTYHIYPATLLDLDNTPLFTVKEKKIFHWGLRDMLQAAYHTSGAEQKQDLIYKVMGRVIDQTIPAVVIDNPDVLWNPYSNQVFKKGSGKGKLVPVPSPPEGGKRCEFILRNKQTEALLDPYYPGYPTTIDREFQLQRRMTEQRVEHILLQLLSTPQALKLGQWLEKKLKRKLRPYDFFYDGFNAGAQRSMAPIDRQLANKYPDTAAFAADMPRILQKIGFPPKIAEAVTNTIEVQQTEAISHGGWREMSGDKSYVRINIPPGGMDYKLFQLALHEYGHDLQLAVSLDMMDYYFLKDVPADSFSESFAMMLEASANDILGLESQQMDSDMAVFRAFWRAFTVSGPSLVEMRMWHWMYGHPQATVAQFQAAAMSIAKEVWDEYYAPVFHEKDVTLLLVFNHLVRGVLYFPEYPLGEVIAFQINDYVKGKNRGEEMIRMLRIGALTPDQWMQQAVGTPVSIRPLQQAIDEVLSRQLPLQSQ
jgi:hypothetical protein